MGRLGEEPIAMKAFILAVLAAVIVAVIGGVALNSMQKPADRAFTTTSVRLGA